MSVMNSRRFIVSPMLKTRPRRMKLSQVSRFCRRFGLTRLLVNSGYVPLRRCATLLISWSVRASEARYSGGAAAMQQIVDWLEKLGMSEYAQRFTENGITVAALPHVTDQDLK